MNFIIQNDLSPADRSSSFKIDASGCSGKAPPAEPAKPPAEPSAPAQPAEPVRMTPAQERALRQDRYMELLARNTHEL